MFDEGLWSADDSFRVVVAKRRFEESGPDAWLLKQMAGRLLQFAPRSTLRPNPAYLRRHREKWELSGA